MKKTPEKNEAPRPLSESLLSLYIDDPEAGPLVRILLRLAA